MFSLILIVLKASRIFSLESMQTHYISDFLYDQGLYLLLLTCNLDYGLSTGQIVGFEDFGSLDVGCGEFCRNTEVPIHLKLSCNFTTVVPQQTPRHHPSWSVVIRFPMIEGGRDKKENFMMKTKASFVQGVGTNSLPSDRNIIVITGAAGFLGSHILRAVRAAFPEDYIFALDKTWTPEQKRVFTEEYDGKNMDTLQLNITDADAVRAFFTSLRNVTAVVHSAGIVPNANQHYDTSDKEYLRCFAVNVDGAQNVLEAAKAAGVRAFVYTSSLTVLIDDGTTDHRNLNESISTGGATLPYARTKTIAENTVLEASSETFKTCSLRPSVLFGPGDGNLIPSLHSCIAKRETPFVIGNPIGTLYDFTYVTNVADAHVLALKNLLTTATAAGQAFFITNGEPVSFRTFCVAVWAGFGHVPPFEVHVPVLLAWILGLIMEIVTWVFGGEATLSRGSVQELTMDAYCDITKARKVLGYTPRVGLAEGIRLSCNVIIIRVKGKDCQLTIARTIRGVSCGSKRSSAAESLGLAQVLISTLVSFEDKPCVEGV